MGGAMDLVAGVRRVVVLMEHVSKQGDPRILERCDLPLTGAGVVDLIITDLCVLECNKRHRSLKLVELAPGATLEHVRSNSKAAILADD
jgi:3-oxoacid CoA-transferase subunit B